MNYLLTTYLLYIAISMMMTIWVGRTLFVSGKVFLMEIFKNDELLVNSINKLLLIGFYLINLGYLLQNVTGRSKILTAVDSIEMLSEKIGVMAVVLGIVHFVNLFILFQLRSRSKKNHITSEPITTNA